MINLGRQDQVSFHLHIYFCSCVKIRVNPVLTQPLKDRVRVIGFDTHLGRPVFFPEPRWVKPKPD